MCITELQTTHENTLLAYLPGLTNVEHVFHPIVNIHTGQLFGVEAQVHDNHRAGFENMADLIDTARKKGLRHQLDMYLRQKVFTEFFRFKQKHPVKLFYKLDPRICRSPDYRPGRSLELLRQQGQVPADVCFELPANPGMGDASASDVADRYHLQGYRIAITNFDIHTSGLQLFDNLAPDYVKIHQRFFKNLQEHPKNRLILTFLIEFAHLMGCSVVAWGVRNKEEFIQCRESGCDMIQGNFVQPPEHNLASVRQEYESIGKIPKKDRRVHVDKDRSLIASETKYLEPVLSDCTVVNIFDQFRKNRAVSFFPVIDHNGEPLGIIQETAFKEYIFSKFGRQLLENPSFGKDISRFVTKIPVADVHSSVESLIESYTRFNNNEGLLMVENMQYIGVLSTNSLLKLINEKNLTLARNQNPLTQLPGNNLINEYLSQSLADAENIHHLIYFDFDHFKPFNDRYGFRNGDRLILMFAEMIKKTAFSENRFVGHVGGDDFFMGIRNSTLETVEDQMSALASEFQKNAESFYDSDTVKNGFLLAGDRQGKEQKLPLMTVSVAILELPDGNKNNLTVEDTANMLARLKKKAKHSDTGIAAARLQNILSG
ncbi:MAG: GGDEF domain-containing protein [Desulfotignum sp.]|nr:EAL and GGDEF domain-containing protein [Desulfobacteraceae bacterium]